MSDVYTLAIDGFFPRLRSLRVYVLNAVINTALAKSLTMRKLRMSNLETFDLHLNHRDKPAKREEQVKWTAVKTLISDCIMPCLQRFSFVYQLSTSTEFRDIFQSSIFNNDNRHICVRFVLNIAPRNVLDSSDITNIFNIRSSRCNEHLVEYVSLVFVIFVDKTNVELTSNSFICDLYFRLLITNRQDLIMLGLLHHGQVGRYFLWIIMI
jgi:hypothetical protein